MLVKNKYSHVQVVDKKAVVGLKKEMTLAAGGPSKSFSEEEKTSKK